MQCIDIDVNGNGQIDGGQELFGEVLGLGGGSFEDGFQALSLLDSAEYGGNQNGIVDPDDLLFAQLLLWNDGNRNGVSEPGELRPLSETNIVGLNLSGRTWKLTKDQHGNDLSLRAAYLRSDGTSGLLVDAFFLTR